MGFLNTLGQISANKKQFKEWEKQDNNKKEQRKALAAKQDLTKDRLDKAKSQGKVIMNTVDIMDTHSEEVSENVETTIMPLAQLAPLLALIGSGGGIGKFVINPLSKAHNKAYSSFMQSETGEKIVEIAQKYSKDLKDGKTIDIAGFKRHFYENSAWSLKDAFLRKKNVEALSKSGDKELEALAESIKTNFLNNKSIKGYNKKIAAAVGTIAGIVGFVFVGANILAAKLQVKSSRIARWQSRQDLNDPKYFVQYTDEQIAQAKKNLEENKVAEKNGVFGKGLLGGGLFGFLGKNEDNNFGHKNGLISTIKGVLQDNKKHDEWKESYNLEDRKIKRPLSKEELQEAEKSQEVIQRITKEINNKAEEYSENMEVAAGVLIGGTPFLGAGISAIINTIMTKTGLGDKTSKKAFEKFTKGLDKDKALYVKDLYESVRPENIKKDASFVDKMNNLKNLNNFISEASGVIFNKEAGKSLGLFEKLSKVTNLLKTTKFGRNAIIGIVGATITGTIGALIGLKLQKSSARAGRYIAKREIESDANNFVGYSKEDFKEVFDITAKKETIGKRLLNYITFLPREIKDYFDYEKYKKTKAKEDKQLLQELVKLDVNEKQLKEAKDLQRKLFTTFENVDDKSQEYSESVEAANEMLQPFIPVLGYIIAAIPLAFGGVKLYKGGKFKAAESITGFFAKHTKILKGKLASKYLNEISNNISSITQNAKHSQNMNVKDIQDLLNKIMPEGQNFTPYISKFKDVFNEMKNQETGLDKIIKEIASIDVVQNAKLSKGDIETLINAIGRENISYVVNILGIKADSLETLYKFADELPKEINISKILNILAKKCEGVKIPPLKNILPENITQQFTDVVKSLGKGGSYTLAGMKGIIETSIKNGDWRKLAKGITDNENIPQNARNIINKLVKSNITNEQAYKIFKNIETVIDNIPAKELNKIIQNAMEAFKKNPAGFIEALKSGKIKSALVTGTAVKISALTGTTYAGLTLLLSYIIESAFASMQKKAGRLGVMKALEELQDPSFYADEETKQAVNNANTSQSTLSPMMQKIIADKSAK